MHIKHCSVAVRRPPSRLLKYLLETVPVDMAADIACYRPSATAAETGRGWDRVMSAVSGVVGRSMINSRDHISERQKANTVISVLLYNIATSL